jgi:hypothetical protein
MLTENREKVVHGRRGALRIAAERLLSWGFEPREIADQLDCSVSWINEIRRQRVRARVDAEESAMRAISGERTY